MINSPFYQVESKSIKTPFRKTLLFLFSLTFFFSSCMGKTRHANVYDDPSNNPPQFTYSCDPSLNANLALTSVFDGSEASLKSNWHSWQQSEVSTNWYVENGAINLKRGIKFDELVLNGSYESFLLKFEWSISSGGNSGVKYNVNEESRSPIGFEYQIIDDNGHPDALLGTNGNRKTATLYDIEPRSPSASLSVAGKFNQGCISLVNGKIEHWLNGVLAVSVDLDSDDIKAKVASSKFRNLDNYLSVFPRQIFLQDHGDEVSFKNISILKIQ